MVLDKLTLEENSYSGFSHQVAVTFADLAALPAGLTGTLTVGVVAAQDIILRGALVVDTQFSGGGITSITASVGDSANGVSSILAAQQVLSAAPVTVAAVTLGFTAAGTLTITLTSVTANLNLATAGQFRVLYSQTKLAKYKSF